MNTLFLVQHGRAKAKDEDPERPLTLQGRRETERIAELAAKLDLDIQEIRHSGKTRAEETAAIYGRALGLMGQVKAVEGLNPTDDVMPIVDELAGENKPIMLVGHLPFMPRLVGQLVQRDAENSPVDFHNSGVVCLARDAEGWKVNWQLNPG
jgi:phosphohistidine phosphatase